MQQMLPEVLTHLIQPLLPCCFLLSPHPRCFGAGWWTFHLWGGPSPVDDKSTWPRWTQEEVGFVTHQTNQSWGYPAVSPWWSTQCVRWRESKEEEWRTVWGSPERSKRRLRVRTSPQCVWTICTGGWEVGRMRSLLILGAFSSRASLWWWSH